jgi:hypothetical protein
MKKLIYMLILLILAQTVYALPTRIQILNLEYENNRLSLTDQITKLGYYPDRKIQPDSGFTCQIISETDDILYNFKFAIPDKIFVDVTDPIKDELSGGIVKLNKTSFALIVPYFKEAKEIRFYNEKNNEVLSIDVSEEQLASKKGIIWLLVGALLVLIAGIFLFITRKK